jgi:LAO/AO transport system kinase
VTRAADRAAQLAARPGVTTAADRGAQLATPPAHPGVTTTADRGATPATPPAHPGVTTTADRGAQLADRACAGDRRGLARLLTEIENRTPVAEAALRRLYPLAGRAHLVGVTGAPGAGKSTLVAALVRTVRASGRAAAVLAIDPSSPITGGAILGDRVRMQEHAGDREVFIRSMASRGHAGGLAAAAADAAAALDAAGFPVVFLETVGAGQSEVEVAAIADTTVVVEAPEMGDEVQAIKAGLLEVADLVVVTKGDRPGAQRTAAQMRAMLTIGAQDEVDAGGRARAHGRRRPKRPAVYLVTAPTGDGVPELLGALDRRAARRDDGMLEAARLARASAQLEGILAERLRARLRAPGLAPDVDGVVREVASHELDPYEGADRIMERIAADD